MVQEDRTVQTSTLLLVCVFVALTLALSIFRFLNSDEVEHLHSTWYVLNGALPYVDFFEHHHSLLWYCLAPLLMLTGQSASAVVAFRLVFFGLTLAILWATYRLALECRGSRAVARLSVALLASMTTFVYLAIEIRPDVPQVLFGVLSALYLVRLFRTRAPRDAVLSGLFAGLAFLFLQKAVFVLLFYPLLFAAQAVRRRQPWRMGLYFLVAFTAVCLPFFVYLAATRSLDDYLVTNWIINIHVRAMRAAVSFLSPVVVRDFVRNAVFLALAAGMAVTALRRRLGVDYAVPACLGLGTVAVVFAMNRVVDRYLVAAVPFLAVAVAAWLADVFDRLRVRGSRAVAAIAIICLVPCVAMVRAIGRSNAGQFAKIQYVLDHSRPGDRMFDEWRDYNLFRPDAHYFWFFVRPAVGHYSRMMGGRFADFDLCRVIDTAKPKFVSDRRGDLERCGMAGRYRPTPFARLVERVAE